VPVNGAPFVPLVPSVPRAPLQTYAVEPAASVIAAPPAGQFASPEASCETVGLVPLPPAGPTGPGAPWLPLAPKLIAVSNVALQRCLSGSMIRIVPTFFSMHAWYVPSASGIAA